jgi:hypothetical protein
MYVGHFRLSIGRFRLQVKKRQREDRKSAAKELPNGGDAREELDFMFEDDLDMPQGRHNKFSSM